MGGGKTGMIFPCEDECMPGQALHGWKGRLLALCCLCIPKDVSMGLGINMYLFLQRRGMFDKHAH